MLRPSRGAAAALLLVIAGAGCGPGGWDEVARVRGPDGLLDAVVVEQNGGATTSFGYHVFVVPRGAPAGRTADSAVAYLYGATRNADAYGVTPRWVAPDTLAVEYDRAARVQMAERLVAAAGAERMLHVVLRPGAPDTAAPPGGMFHTLRGQPGQARP